MSSPASSPATGRKHRDCPALNGPISGADCGSQRGSRLACPAHCAFFPFGAAGYDLWLRVDAEWVKKSLNRIIATVGRDRLQAVMKEHHVPMGNRTLELECALNRALHLLLFLVPGPAGRTVAQDWEADGWTGLNNDERVMMHHRRTTLPTVVEVQRIEDAQTLVCLDLLDPERPAFKVLDRGAAAQSARFTRLLTLLSDYPHFSRLGLPPIPIPHHLWGSWHEQFQARHAGQEGEPLTAKRFLAAHLSEFTALLGTLAHEHRQRLLDRFELHQCLASFRLGVPAADFEARLRTRSDFRVGEPPADQRFARPQAYFDWICTGETAALDGAPAPAPGGEPVTLGTLRLYAEFALIETRSRLRHALARQLCDRQFATELQFHEESVLDLTQVANARNRHEALVAQAGSAVFGGAKAPPSTATEAGQTLPPEPA